METENISLKNIINFSRGGRYSLFISLIIIVVGGAVVFSGDGFNLGIDFQSGVSLNVAIARDTSVEELRTLLQGIGSISVQEIDSASGRYLIRATSPDPAIEPISVRGEIERLLIEQYDEDGVQILEGAFIGPRFSRTIARQSIVLTVVALIIIMLYIWFRFRFRFSIAAISALVHDTLMTFAFLGVTGIELSTTTIAAVLTIIGYSLNDTVVIFDRIRENSKHTKGLTYRQIVDKSITQSLSRTLVTSLTTLLAVVAIYLFSRGAIKDFAITMIFGIFVGTYSSIFIAAPLLELLTRGDMDRLLLPRRRSADNTEHAYGKEEAVTAAKNAPQKLVGATASDIDADRIRRELIQQKQRSHKKKKRKR